MCFNKWHLPGMASSAKRLRRAWKSAGRRAREIRMIAQGLISTNHPILAHIIPMRRCNLSCAYCNEYDDHSKPVAIDLVCERLDRLAELGTNVITISGGEPLLHPDIVRIVDAVQERKRFIQGAGPGQ